MFQNAIQRTVEENEELEKQYRNNVHLGGDFSHLSLSAQDVLIKYTTVEYVEDMDWEIINLNVEGNF